MELAGAALAGGLLLTAWLAFLAFITVIALMQPAGYLCQQGLVVEEDLPGPGNTVYVFDYGCLLEHEGATVWVRKGLLPLMEKVTYLPSEPILHDYRIERIREGDRLRLLLMTADVFYDARTDESEVVLLDHEARVKRFDAR